MSDGDLKRLYEEQKEDQPPLKTAWEAYHWRQENLDWMMENCASQLADIHHMPISVFETLRDWVKNAAVVFWTEDQRQIVTARKDAFLDKPINAHDMDPSDQLWIFSVDINPDKRPPRGSFIDVPDTYDVAAALIRSFPKPEYKDCLLFWWIWMRSKDHPYSLQELADIEAGQLGNILPRFVAGSLGLIPIDDDDPLLREHRAGFAAMIGSGSLEVVDTKKRIYKVRIKGEK